MNDSSNQIKPNISSVFTIINSIKTKEKQEILIKKNKKNKNKNILIILFLLIILLILVLLFNIMKIYEKTKKQYFYNNTKYNIKYNTKNNTKNNIKYNTKNNIKHKGPFDDMLPRINLNNNTTPSLEEIFNSRILYISDVHITKEYIKYLRPVNETEEAKFKKRYSENETRIPPYYFKKRSDQYNYVEFNKLCLEEKLIDSNKIEYNNKPLISIIFPSYNKETILLKSIRSVQNQNFKNIEIIIVNDCSTDNSSKVFNYLLETDPRVRIFHHLKNMGCWRSRLDGLFYSRGKYLMLFDTGDLYEDNYVLKDAFDMIEKYRLDSVKFLFRMVRSYKNLDKSTVVFHVNEKSRIIYNTSNIEKFNREIFRGWGNIWTRITRANIHFKGIYLLNDYVLNLYKNQWDDVWFNTYIHKVSFSFIICERIVYVYLANGKGVGSPKKNSEVNRDKYIKEQLGFLYFNYNMLPKTHDKKSIVNALRKFNDSTNSVNFSFLKSKFYMLYDLINILIKDPYVSNADKNFLNKLLKESKEREKGINTVQTTPKDSKIPKKKK